VSIKVAPFAWVSDSNRASASYANVVETPFGRAMLASSTQPGTQFLNGGMTPQTATRGISCSVPMDARPT
jgi:hypothetical protein